MKKTSILETIKMDTYDKLLSNWVKNQKKLGKNTKPGEGTRKRLMKNADFYTNNLLSVYDKMYKKLMSDWKKTQKKMGKNPKPGEGTRKRLFKEVINL